MKTQLFTDKNGQELIVKRRKSAIFFEAKTDIDKPNSYGDKHKEFIDIHELHKLFEFTQEEFERFVAHCQSIATDSWKNFEPKDATSEGSDYDDYYDRDFDNNGSLSVYNGIVSIQGPYTQLKSDGDIIRLIKFKKRTFESFVYDLEQLIKK